MRTNFLPILNATIRGRMGDIIPNLPDIVTFLPTLFDTKREVDFLRAQSGWSAPSALALFLPEPRHVFPPAVSSK